MNRLVRRHASAALLALAAALLALLLAAGPASAANVANGGFESGTLEGWRQAFSGDEDEGRPAGGWYALSGTKAPLSSMSEEVSELEDEIAAVKQELAQLEAELEQLESESEPTERVEEEIEEAEEFLEYLEGLQRQGLGTVLGPYEGSFDAVADENNPSSMILYQDVALEPGVPQQLSLYFNYHSYDEMAVPSPDSLSSETPGHNQQVRVDVMKAGSSPESLEPGDVLATLYASKGGPLDPTQIPWTHLTADLSAYAGQTVRIRIAAVDNQFYLNAGVDDVTISPLAAPPPSNEFTFGKLKRNLRKGTGKLTVNVPGPGVVKLANAGSKPATASVSKLRKAKQPKKPKAAVKKATKTATAAGPVTLPVNPTGAALKYLKAKHSLSTKVAVTFTPTGGTAATTTKTVVLKLAKPKRK